MSRIRVFLLTCFIVLAPVFGAFALEDIDGFIGQNTNGEYYFISNNFIKSYTIILANAEVGAQLKRLGQLDAIHGRGSFASDDEIILETIDFVGLHRLLGAWTSETYLFNFKNFADVSLYPAMGRQRTVGAGTMKYAISPGDGSVWKIFFSNANQVVLASLDLMTKKQQAILTFYDVQTGSEKSSILLTKVRD
jgi:hypothetical protein